MKIDLTDVTFFILIRNDSIQRLENVKIVTDSLSKYFDTTIIVLETDTFNNGILKKILNKKIHYQFMEDKDSVMHKTRYYNYIIRTLHTKYIAIWDVDIVVDKKAICEAMKQLRTEADVAYPYNGVCFDVPEVIKRLYFKHQDIRMLIRHKDKMNLLYKHQLVGGAVIIDTNKYLQSGGDNEEIYGWGNDDFIRHARFQVNKLTIYRTSNPLFHLCHPRGKNSQYRNPFSQKISNFELSNEKNKYILCHDVVPR